ncbi:MAG TPA: M14 family metallopeptidase, partial [Bryobacteraceae bacterium]|nr:M14 family metallopeptidase [Bryobacteraceae bacterium]
MRSAVLVFTLLVLPAFSQKVEFWPGAQYDTSIPSPEKVLGFAPGLKHATHADIVRYFEALAAAAPSRVRVVEYGKTWEGRKLIYAVIGSESNIARIEQIKAGMKKLADPEKTSVAEAAKLIASLPAVISLSHAVHGNEISSPDAAMMTAYHLLAARNDQLTSSVRQNVVVLIDPLQNPDGRDRFVQNYRASAGLEPDPDQASAERYEPWPGGRSNHYLFDMNRDWFAVTQPETRGRIAYLNQWLPVVFADLHEMGTDSTYYFPPGAEPFNPHLTARQKEQGVLFGKNNAKWFDQFGYAYFTREVFDEFYPGYGESWPFYYGALGMTYENPSVRGLIARRADDSLYTFQESVKRQFVVSVSTCETAAANRERLLKDFAEYSQTAVDEGRKEETKEYILPHRGDFSAVDKLAHLLAEQGVVVKQATAAFRNSGQEYPAGSYVVVSAQPRKRLVRTLLDESTEMDPVFVKEQERRRKKKLRDEIYDLTAWSLPMLYNVECVRSKEVSSGGFEAVTGAYQPKGTAPARGAIAYVVPWGSQAAGRFLTAALRAGLKVNSVGKAFTQNGRRFGAGTLVVGVKQNDATVHDIVSRIAVDSGADVIASNSSWVDAGINYGSNYSQLLKKPAIVMAWDTPTSSASAGATRFVLERLYGYPVTVVRTQALAMADLSRYQVLILPDAGDYAQALGPAAERIKAWVRAGGTLIGIGDALDYLSSQPVRLLALQQESLAVAPP